MHEPDLFSLTFEQTRKALAGSIHHQDLLEAWAEHITALAADLQKYHEALAKVVNSDELTPRGKERRRAELQALLRQRLEADQQHLDHYTRRMDTIKVIGGKKAEPTDLERVLHFLQAQEMRADLKHLDPVELRGEYESRSQDVSGQYDAWLEAVESSPVPLLPGEVLDRGRAARALRRLDDESRQRLTDLAELKRAHEHFLTLASRELPARDVVAEMAAGERNANGD